MNGYRCALCGRLFMTEATRDGHLVNDHLVVDGGDAA